MCQHSISPFGRIPLVKISDVKNGNRFGLKPSNIRVDTPKSHCMIVKRSSAIVANAATQVKSLFISNITCGITVVKSLLFAQSAFFLLDKLRTHSDEKPFGCKQCNLFFRSLCSRKKQRSARILDPGNSRRESASFFLARPREMIF